MIKQATALMLMVGMMSIAAGELKGQEGEKSAPPENAILPRGKVIDDKHRLANEEANKLITKLVDEENIFFLNINDRFLVEDGMVRKDLLKDWLHPSPEGYAVWAEAMEPTLAKLMGDKVRGKLAPQD